MIQVRINDIILPQINTKGLTQQGQPLNYLLYDRFLLLFFHRQVMHINMTGKAVREQLHLLFVVRCTMALRTIRDLAVGLMTGDAGNLTMFTRRTLPLGVNTFVTAIAGFNIGVAGETDLQRCVNTHMTVQTILDRLYRVASVRHNYFCAGCMHEKPDDTPGRQSDVYLLSPSDLQTDLHDIDHIRPVAAELV